MIQYACPRCGADDLVKGVIQATGSVRFRPDDAKFMTLHTADVPVQALMCAGCGGVVLLGDYQKLKAVRTAAEQPSLAKRA